MPNPKKILLFSASYGSGHTRAAEALQAHFEALGIEVTHVDLLSFLPDLLAKGFRFPYISLTKRTPRLWGMIYDLMKNSWALRRYYLSMNAIFRHKQKDILNLIHQESPDIVVTTHMTPGYMLTYFLEKGIAMPPHYVQITDYGYHPLWYSKHASGYMLSSTDMIVEMQHEGIDASLLHVTGIPVDPTFSQAYDQTALRKELNLPTDTPVFLIMTGGMGLVNPRELVEAIERDNSRKHIVIVTGKNQKLYTTLTEAYSNVTDIHVLGWINNVADYMKAADVVCTKPGGITSTECLTLGKPLVIFKPIPGQEEDNTNFLLRHNLATHFSSKTSLNIDAVTKKLVPWHELFEVESLPFIE